MADAPATPISSADLIQNTGGDLTYGTGTATDGKGNVYTKGETGVGTPQYAVNWTLQTPATAPSTSPNVSTTPNTSNNPAVSPTAVTTPTPVSTMPAGVKADPNSVVDTLKTMGIDTSPANIATVYKGAGFTDAYTGTAAQNTALNKYFQTGAGKPTSTGIVTSNQSQTQMNSDSASLAAANAAATAAANAKAAAAAAAGTGTGTGGAATGTGTGTGNTTTPQAANTTVTNSDGSFTMTDSQGHPFQFAAGTSPGQAQAQMATYNAAVSSVTTDQATITSLNNYDVNTDPAAVAAVQSITNSYNVLIQQMTDKNTMLAGSINANSAQNGMLQYGNEMDGMYKSAENDAAVQRIATLKSQELAAINASNQAYKDGNAKALTAAQADYQKAFTDGQTALAALDKTLQDQIASNQAQARIDQTTANQQITNDIRVSTSIAQSVADQIKASGVTDPAKIKAFIDATAADPANNISNPATLEAAVAKAQATEKTTALQNLNTETNIKDNNIRTNIAVQNANNKNNNAQMTAFQKDVKVQNAKLNSKTSAGRNTGDWGDTYNYMAQTYGSLSYKLPDGSVVGFTQQLTPAQVKAAGGNPAVDQTIIDIALNKTANGKKVAGQ